jgi:lipoate-protein ligase A
MQFDADTLGGVSHDTVKPTLRFFRFKNRTVSYGRLQKPDLVDSQIPYGWETVRRPTGGGIVFHDGDLCLSLCWRARQGPLPRRPQDQYRWIHSIILGVLAKETSDSVRMAACCDVKAPDEPFAVRTCFQNPVGYDLLKDQQKIVGGALRCTRVATLYQGSIQIPIDSRVEGLLGSAFQERLAQR